MGAGNVAAVLTNWSRLPDPAFRVMVQMALIALDRATPPTYYGGRTLLIHALGRAEDDHAGRLALNRAIKTLVEAGAIEVVSFPTKVRAGRYNLNV